MSWCCGGDSSQTLSQSESCSFGPMGSASFYNADGLGLSVNSMSYANELPNHESPAGDAHLRSLGEVTGYHIRALDGDIGHLEDFLVDDATWTIDYALVDTKNWGFGNHVLVSIAEIKAVDWFERYIRLELTRYKIKSSPSWKEPDWSDRSGM